jgi:hypothetical protein
MEIIHELDRVTISKNTEDDVAFLISNKNSGYVYLSTGKKSRYEGVFFRLGDRVYRAIADISPNRGVDRIVNKFHSIERHSHKNMETFFMPHNLNSFSYELENEDWVMICLDVRESYDTTTSGSYEVSEEDDKTIIKCTRRGEEFFVVVKSDKTGYGKMGEFRTIYYERDVDRNSPPFDMQVYCALKLRVKKMVISFSDKKETATEEAENIFKNLDDVKKKQRAYVRDLLENRGAMPDEIDLAYKCCINSLDQLTTPDGIIAGFPWFFQNWTRDELISIKNLNKDLKRRILLRYLEHIKDDGRIPNILSDTGSGNADSIGWLFKRIDESLEMFTLKERKIIRDRLIKSIARLNENYVGGLLMFNNSQETWMDTSFGDSGRGGARIEVQCLLLEMYRLTYRLTRNEKFSHMEKILRDMTREKFWDEHILKDGLNDPTIRPNAFIAAYVYPELLSRGRWITCFENVLPRLWCDWGGLSSIDREDPLFLGRSTGEDPRSYHRGDSWYFMNNLAALVMYGMGEGRFKVYINKIVKASTEDVLWRGMIGHHSEISSAVKPESLGCGAQAWSAAMYIELINEIFLS